MSISVMPLIEEGDHTITDSESELLVRAEAGIFSGEIALTENDFNAVEVTLYNRSVAGGPWKRVLRTEMLEYDSDDPQLRLAPKEEAYGFRVTARCKVAGQTLEAHTMWYRTEV